MISGARYLNRAQQFEGESLVAGMFSRRQILPLRGKIAVQDYPEGGSSDAWKGGIGRRRLR
jgi:hypothetical protein